jgi:hypothetical protein
MPTDERIGDLQLSHGKYLAAGYFEPCSFAKS